MWRYYNTAGALFDHKNKNEKWKNAIVRMELCKMYKDEVIGTHCAMHASIVVIVAMWNELM